MAKQYNETIKQRALIREYNRLAKKADRMMRELERFSRYDEYKDILKYSYRVAKKDIEKWTPEGLKGRAPRWQRNMPTDTRALKAKIRDIEAFINKPTSTITGIKRVYQNRANTFNGEEKTKEGKGGYGTEFTWQQLAHFFEDGGLFDEAKDKYGSKTVLISFGKMQANKKKVLNKIQNFDKDDIIISDDDSENVVINNMLSDYGYKIEELLS